MMSSFAATMSIVVHAPKGARTRQSTIATRVAVDGMKKIGYKPQMMRAPAARAMSCLRAD
jgi:hypothetical protein